MNEIFDKDKSFHAVNSMLAEQERAIESYERGEKCNSPFCRCVEKYGVVNGYVGSPDKLLDLYTEKIIGKKLDGKERCLLQFYLAPCTKFSDSDYLYETGLDLFEKNKDIFEPKKVAEYEKKKLEDILKEKLTFMDPENDVDAWIENSKILNEKYNSDPRNIFKDDGKNVSLNEAYKRILKFKEFGIKVGPLFLKECVESGVYDIKDKDLWRIPIPPDIHIIRFCTRTSVKDLNGLKELNGLTHEKISKIVQNHYSEITKESNLNPIKVDDAIWLWGREACSKKKCSSCPVDICDPGISVKHQRHKTGKRKGMINGKFEVKKSNHTLQDFL